MKTIYKYLVYFALTGLFALFCYISGCVHGKKVKVCPAITTNIITIHDTTTHVILNNVNHYVQHTDTVIRQLPGKIDTVFVLGDYFATHQISRKWENDTLRVDLTDFISQNKSVNNIFKYQIKIPFTTIINKADNSVFYAKYFDFGLSVPVYPFKSNTISNINYISLDALYIFPKGYLKANWQPYTKIYSAGFGVKIFKFKK
jgi:hypothetical protein